MRSDDADVAVIGHHGGSNIESRDMPIVATKLNQAAVRTMRALMAAALIVLVCGSARAAETALADELARLVATHGVAIKGIGKTAGVTAPDAGGDLRARLGALLADFDHVMIQQPGGPVERVIIVARRSHDVAPVIADAPGGAPQLTLASAPVFDARISSGYGPRLHPVLG